MPRAVVKCLSPKHWCYLQGGEILRANGDERLLPAQFLAASQLASCPLSSRSLWLREVWVAIAVGRGCYLQGGEVMCANGNEGPLPAQVLVQLVLQVDEAGVARCVQGHATQHRTSHKGPHERCLWLDHHAQRFLACKHKIEMSLSA